MCGNAAKNMTEKVTDEMISSVFRNMTARRNAKLSPERRREIAVKAGRASAEKRAAEKAKKV